MDKSEISKVVVLSNSTEVNTYLDLGWKIIETYVTSEPMCKCQTLLFVMGWFGEYPGNSNDTHSLNPSSGT